MTKRSILLCVPALIAGVVVTAVPAGASLPSGATKVPVTAGSNAALGDVHLANASSISGVVSAAAGGSINTSVSVYRGATQVGTGFTSTGGHYLVGGLPAYATGYAVCVNPFFVSGGNSTTGYLGRCYTTAAYNGGTPPASATKVPLGSNQQKTGINIKLSSAAAISGKIVNSAGTGISGATVTARAKSGSGNGFTFTDSNGNYKFTGLVASSKGYAVCANPTGVNAGPTGYRPRCWKNVAWGGGAIPSGANAVSVSLGHTHTGIKITVPRGAAISGKITTAGTGTAISHASVVALSSHGAFLGGGETNSAGNYTIKGLGASTSNRVCVYPNTSTTPSSQIRYSGKCWKNVSWRGGALPSGTTAVSTSLTHTHTGINLTVSRSTVALGSISGSVVDAATPSTKLEFAPVTIFTSTGGFVNTGSTDVNGNYAFHGLLPTSSGYVICAESDEATTPTAGSAPDTGWAPRCHSDVAWNGGGLPSTATRVTLSAGGSKTGIDVPLHVGGEISGTVDTSGTKFTFLGEVSVDLFTPSGHFLTSTLSDFTDGTFAFKGVDPNATGYIVCFDGRNVVFAAPNYLPQCYNNVNWDGNF